jgi:hypothetical protein
LIYGAVAQLGERMTGSHEANGSIPFSSTNKNKRLRRKLKTSFLFSTCLSRICPAFLFTVSPEIKKPSIPNEGKEGFFLLAL